MPIKRYCYCIIFVEIDIVILSNLKKAQMGRFNESTEPHLPENLTFIMSPTKTCKQNKIT